MYTHMYICVYTCTLQEQHYSALYTSPPYTFSGNTGSQLPLECLQSAPQTALRLSAAPENTQSSLEEVCHLRGGTGREGTIEEGREGGREAAGRDTS